MRYEVDTFRNGPTQTLTIATPPFAITSTEIDPLRECLVFGGIAMRTLQQQPRVNPWLSARGRAALPTQP
jgi:hypothetical protein